MRGKDSAEAKKQKLKLSRTRGFIERQWPESRWLERQWQPQPPPQQDPPDETCGEDAAEAPFPFPFGALNTES